MHFRTNLFLPFAFLALLILGILGISGPFALGDRLFFKGQDLKREVGQLRAELLMQPETGRMDSAKWEDRFEKIDSLIDVIVDDGRGRYYHYPRLFLIALAIGLLILGLIITLFASWRFDVSRLQFRTAKLDHAP